MPLGVGRRPAPRGPFARCHCVHHRTAASRRTKRGSASMATHQAMSLHYRGIDGGHPCSIAAVVFGMPLGDFDLACEGDTPLLVPRSSSAWPSWLAALLLHQRVAIRPTGAACADGPLRLLRSADATLALATACTAMVEQSATRVCRERGTISVTVSSLSSASLRLMSLMSRAVTARLTCRAAGLCRSRSR